ncbi:DUF418 domain-containing protein [Nocardiopsis sp. NPDC007018]|uniref:DUF418 domain-containing protein n=1 Tax=Nocardiopsis sp. NPDC007018 TaxID=3155721 RepID=UPI0033FBE747
MDDSTKPRTGDSHAARVHADPDAPTRPGTVERLATGGPDDPGPPPASGGPSTRTAPPPTPPPRLLLLDVLRGLAILGTLASNIWLFHPALPGTPSLPRELLDPLVNGKFLAMLAMMFGVGLAVQHRAAAARGRPWPGRSRWRQVLLLVEGALHALLLFAWDVLMGYAVTGLLVIWLLGRSERVRSAVMWSALTVNVAFLTVMTVVFSLADASGARPPEPRGLAEYQVLFLEGGYLEQVAERGRDFLGTRIEILVTFPLVLFLFLLGVRLYRSGVFDDDPRGRELRGRLARWGIGLGLPLCLLGSQISVLGQAHRYGFAIVLMLGYVGLVGWLLDRSGGDGRLAGSLRAVGLTALTCYVLQNLLGSVVFYGWGLGLAGFLEERGIDGATREGVLLAVGLGIALVLVAGARWWLRRFGRGPLETVGKRLVSLVPERDSSRGDTSVHPSDQRRS